MNGSAMLETLDAKADDLLAELGAGEAVSDRVIRAISAMLNGEAPKVEDVSKSLAMSTRPQQRALNEEGTGSITRCSSGRVTGSRCDT